MHTPYGWKRDKADDRDLIYAPPKLDNLPSAIDLREHCPPVFDQGQLGSCTANAIAGAHAFAQLVQFGKDFTPSRLFIYYNERSLEGTVDQDSGAEIRDGIKTVANIGVCHEDEWPYDLAQFAAKPPQQCYDDSPANVVSKYQRVTQDVDHLRACLASGSPFVFGFTVYESFESDEIAKTGEVPMPADGEKDLGGHAVMAVGYDDGTERFLVRNSWGDGWGQGGYFTIPYAYVTDSNLASDFWEIELVA